MTYFRAVRTIIGPKCLTAVFGMGTGVATWVWSPEKRVKSGEWIVKSEKQEEALSSPVTPGSPLFEYQMAAATRGLYKSLSASEPRGHLVAGG
jgi:hypothetical protein